MGQPRIRSPGSRSAYNTARSRCARPAIGPQAWRPSCLASADAPVVCGYHTLPHGCGEGHDADGVRWKACLGASPCHAAMRHASRACPSVQTQCMTAWQWRTSISIASPVSTSRRSCHAPCCHGVRGVASPSVAEPAVALRPIRRSAPCRLSACKVVDMGGVTRPHHDAAFASLGGEHGVIASEGRRTRASSGAVSARGGDGSAVAWLLWRGGSDDPPPRPRLRGMWERHPRRARQRGHPCSPFLGAARRPVCDRPRMRPGSTTTSATRSDQATRTPPR